MGADSVSLMSRLVVSVPTAKLAADIAPLPDGVEVIEWALDGLAPRERIDLVVTPYMRGPGVLRRLTNVQTRLVQSPAIGFEGTTAHLPPGSVFANAATVHEASTAELAVGLAIASQRKLPTYTLAQDRGEWAREWSPSLADRRVLLLGYGGVGTAIAARLAPFEVELTAVARRARVEEGVRVHALSDLPELLPQAEIVIVALPGGEETRGIVDGAFLAALPDDALVVNIGRGPLIDTDAMVAEAGRLRFALDVTDPEPLPEGHPLWTAPGIIIVPHVGGASDAMHPRLARLIRRQIDHLLAGEEPENIVLRT